MKQKGIVLSLLAAFTSFPFLHAAEIENLYINGFISQGFLKSDQNNYFGETSDGTFDFNEVGISFKTTITDELTAGLQLFSRDFGDLGNNEVNIDWAFLDYRVNDSFGIRVGKFKKPEGLYNTIRDADMTRTNILMPQGVYSADIRDMNIAMQGIGAYGIIETDSMGYLDYIVYAGTQPVFRGTAIVDRILNGYYGIEQEGKINTKYSVGTMVTWNTPMDGLRFALSANRLAVRIDGTNTAYFWSEPEVNNAILTSTYRTVASVEYQAEKYTLAAEYMKWDFTAEDSPIGGAPIPALGGLPGPGDFDVNRESFYVQGTYNLSEKIKIGAYYSEFYDDLKGVKDRDNKNRRLNQITFSTRYDFNSWWLVKAEVSLFDGTFSVSPDDSGMTDEKWTLFAVKTTVSF